MATTATFKILSLTQGTEPRIVTYGSPSYVIMYRSQKL